MIQYIIICIHMVIVFFAQITVWNTHVSIIYLSKCTQEFFMRITAMTATHVYTSHKQYCNLNAHNKFTRLRVMRIKLMHTKCMVSKQTKKKKWYDPIEIGVQNRH